MDISSLGEKAAAGRVPNPHDKAADYFRMLTSRFIHFTPRTRAILVFIGAIAVIGAWVTPWYVCIGWMNSDPALNVALHSGYHVTNPGNFGQNLLQQGYTAMERDFTGDNLATGPAQLQAIAFTKHDLECWIGLAVLALLAMWTYERPDAPGVHLVRKRFYTTVESAKVVLMVYVIFRCVWKGIDLGTLSTVSAHAQAALTAQFAAAGLPATAVQQYQTTFSIGLLLLVVGLICGGLGVLSGDKAPKVMLDANGYPVPVPRKVRVRATTFAIGAVVLLVLLYGCM